MDLFDSGKRKQISLLVDIDLSLMDACALRDIKCQGLGASHLVSRHCGTAN